MSKPMHMQCPSCNRYIRAPVKETRNECGGIMRRRYCEHCGIIIVTMERIKEHYEKRR